MNTKSYNKGQSHRAVINSATASAVGAVADVGIALGSYIKGIILMPKQSAKPEAKKTVARAKTTVKRVVKAPKTPKKSAAPAAHAE